MLTLEELKKMEANGTLIGAFEVGIEDYHAGPGVSTSNLKDLKVSPQFYRYRKNNRMKVSAPMLLGSMFEAYYSDKSKGKVDFLKSTVLVPSSTPTTKAWRAAVDENAGNGKAIYLLPHMNLMEPMERAMMEHPHASRLCSGASQLSFYWKDPKTGILCRCRPDFLPKTLKIIADLKVSGMSGDKGITEHEIMAKAKYLNYHIQAAFYQWGVEQAIKQGELKIPIPDAFVFNVISSNAPHEICTYKFCPLSMDLGRVEIEELLAKLVNAKKSGKWAPKYTDIVEFSLPNYAFKEGE